MNENEEYFDVLDEDGVWTGETITREQAHKYGIWHRAVLCFVVRENPGKACEFQVLMTKRSINKKQWPGKWDAGAGGHVEAGDIGLFAQIREFKEELDIVVLPEELRYIGCSRSNTSDGKIHNAHFNEYFVTHKKIETADMKIQKEEVDEVKWMDYLELKQMIIERSPDLTEKWNCYDVFTRYMDKYILKIGG